LDYTVTAALNWMWNARFHVRFEVLTEVTKTLCVFVYVLRPCRWNIS
jgi:hypothetical protein